MYILASGQMKVTKQGRPRNVIKAGEYTLGKWLASSAEQVGKLRWKPGLLQSLRFRHLEELIRCRELRFAKNLAALPGRPSCACG